MSDKIAEALREQLKEKLQERSVARELFSVHGRDSALPARSVDVGRHEGYIFEDPKANPNGCCGKCFVVYTTSPPKPGCTNFNCDCH